MSELLQPTKLKYFVVSFGILSILCPLAFWLIYIVRKHNKIVRDIKEEKLDIREYVSKFDNMICNNAMMANSLINNLQMETESFARYYYICQVNYYINKCIINLFNMKSMTNQIFKENTNDHVSPRRARLIVKLLNTLRDRSISEMKGIVGTHDAKVEEYITEEAKKHDGIIKHFIKHFNSILLSNAVLDDWIDITYYLYFRVTQHIVN